MANNRARVERLEKKFGGGKGGKGAKGGRCEVCKDRAGCVWVTFRTTGAVDAAGEEELVPHGDHTCAEPCKGCGWTPEVNELVEEVIVTREDAKRVEAKDAAEGRRSM